jgi:hypothetical protein
MAKRVVVIGKVAKPVQTPGGQVTFVQKELTKVYELDATLEEVMIYAVEKEMSGVTVIFESEDPDLRTPKIVRPEN